MSRARTNIEIEETYVEAIMERYGTRTKRKPWTSPCATSRVSR